MPVPAPAEAAGGPSPAPRPPTAAPAPAPLPAGQPIARKDIKGDVALTTAGREVPVSYAVVEADSLIPSSQDDGSDNPAYPQALQPRDRDRPASRHQVAEIAQKLDLRLVSESALASDGAPIVAADGVVESGNGRVAEAAAAILERIAPAARLEIVKDIFTPSGESARGKYSPALNLVQVAMDPEATVRHEGLHALRAMGMFTDSEWAALERRASAWRAEYEIDRAYAGRTEATKIEEAIAHAYEDTAAWAASPPGIRRIFARIAGFFRALANALRGLGFQTWENVFERVESGEVGARREAAGGRRAFAAGMAGAQPSFASAWHGSGADFNRFTTEKIGTGEGAAAYGWGLYFTGRKEIADYYRSSLANVYERWASVIRERVPEIDPKIARQLASDIGNANLATGNLNAKGRPSASIVVAVHARNPEARDFIDMNRSAIIDAVDEARKIEKAGRLYKVDLAPAEDEYLYWDKPLSEQSEKVKAALSKRGIILRPEGHPDLIRGIPLRPPGVERAADTGGEFYRAMAEDLDPENASKELAASGIPGIKYLDQGSRGKDEGTYNYVIFDESAVRIEEKFALWPRRAAVPRSQLEQDLAKVSFLPERRSVFRHVRDTLAEWRVAREDLVNEGIRGMIDAFHPMKVIEEKLHGGTPLDTSVSAWKMMHMTQNLDNVMAVVMGVKSRTGVVGGPLAYDAAKGMVTVRAGIKPLSEIFRPLAEMGEESINAWKAWAIARRAKVLMAEGRENNVPQWFIDRYIDADRAHLKDGRNVFRETFDGWRAFNGAMLDFAEQAGGINAGQRALWDDAFYIPFYRIIDAETVGPQVKRGVANQTPGIKRLTGGESPIGDVIENIVLNTTKLVDSSFKTIAMARAMPLGVQSGAAVEVTKEINWRMAHTPLPQVRKALKEQAGIDLGKLTKDQRDQWLNVFAMAPPRGKDIVFYMDKGKRRYFQVRDPSILQALTLLHPEQMNALLRMMGWVKGQFTNWVTIDPAYMIANAMRDSLHSWVISHGRIRFGAGPAKGFRQALGADPSLIAIMASGAGTGGFYRNTAVRTTIESPAHRKTILGSSKDAFHAYQKLGFASEYANRLARYEGGIKSGETEAEAAFQALDLLNFSSRGGWPAMRVLTTIAPFINARIQGLYRLGRAYADDPKAFLAHAAVITAATMALYFLNSDDDRYKDLPDWDKDTYYHFFLDNIFPVEALDAAGVPKAMRHLRLPKPFEIGALFSTIPERAALVLGGTDRAKDTLTSVKRILLDTFAFNPVPQAFRPLFEEVANLNFFTGRPIVGMALEGVRPEAQYEANTSETVRLLAKAIPEWAGPAGSPVRLEHLVRGYFGAVGMYLLGASDSVLRGLFGDREMPASRWDQIPVVQRFLRLEPPFTTKWVGEFYDMKREVDATWRALNKYRREGDIEAYKALRLEKADELKLRKRLDNAYAHLHNIDRRIERITLSKTMDAATKRERIDKFLEQKQRIAARYANIRLK